MQNFIENILNGKKSKRSMVDQLYKQPLKDKDGDNPTIPIIDPNYAQYIDLLFEKNLYLSSPIIGCLILYNCFLS